MIVKINMYFLILAVAIMSLLVPEVVLAQNTEGRQLNYSNLKAKNHPRLLMDSKDFRQLKSKIASGKYDRLAMLHNTVMDICDNEIMNDTSILKHKLDDSGKRILHVSNKALARIFFCSYAYRMTEDRKYLEKAEADINAVCGFKDWNPKHFLDVGEMALAVAIGYDWLYKELKASTKTKAESALVRFAFEPSYIPEYTWFYRRFNNWNQVCNGGLVSAAVAIYEKAPDHAKAVIEKAVETSIAATKAIYSPDGNYPEGPGYWCYGTGFQTLMLAVMDKALGYDGGISEIEGFDKTAEYMLFTVGMENRSFNHSDGGSRAIEALAEWWFADKFNNPSLVYNELRKAESGSYKRSTERRTLPMIMAFANRIDLDRVDAPKKKLWSGRGAVPVVLIHTDWTWSSSDRYLALKGGRANVDHGHMDGGSFVYDAYGKRWAMDLGSQRYAPMENAFSDVGGDLWDMGQNSMRWNIFRYENASHNTITINGARHIVSGEAKITSVINNETELGANLDLSEIVGDQVKSAFRTIKLVNEDYLIVTDQIEAKGNKDATLRWNMLTPASVEIEENRIVLKQEDKKIYLTVESELPVELKEWSTEGPYALDAPNKGTTMVGFLATIKAGKTGKFKVKLSSE